MCFFNMLVYMLCQEKDSSSGQSKARSALGGFARMHYYNPSFFDICISICILPGEGIQLPTERGTIRIGLQIYARTQACMNPINPAI